MQSIGALVVFGLSLLLLSAACSKDQRPAQAPPPSAQPAYGQPGQPQPGQPQPGQPVPGQMSTPGPTALGCQNDSQCVTHRCNTQHQRCAFPCQSDADCIQGTTCFVAGGPVAWCMPKAAGSP